MMEGKPKSRGGDILGGLKGQRTMRWMQGLFVSVLTRQISLTRTWRPPKLLTSADPEQRQSGRHAAWPASKKHAWKNTTKPRADRMMAFILISFTNTKHIQEEAFIKISFTKLEDKGKEEEQREY